MKDPFSDENDPRRLDGALPPATGPTVGRRVVVLALATLTAASCAHLGPAGRALPHPNGRCAHRFCRYFRG